MKKLAITLLFISLLFGCGGGGGDDDSSGKSSDKGLRVLLASIDTAPVDVVSGLAVISKGAFGSDPAYSEIPSGEQILSVTRSKRPAETLATVKATLDSSGRYSLLVSGGSINFPLSGVLLTDGPAAQDSGSSYLRIAHGLVGAQGLSLKVDGVSVETAAYNSASEYAKIAPGTHTITVSRESDSRVVHQGSFTAEAGESYTVFAAGELEYFSQVKILTH